MEEKAQFILKKLNNSGFEAYMVGGCVRDRLLGIKPIDIDIATNAHPDQVEALFEKTVPTGRDYGTMTVVVEGMAFEVTTFRFESDYDGRRPKVIRFGRTLLEDLARRDFTMNAMAVGLDGVLHDPFGGQEDLMAGRIRFVGDPAERLKEDRLRALRYIRFMARFDLKGDLSCLKGTDLTGLSQERIRDEFEKMLLTKGASEGILALLETGLLAQFLPEAMAMVGFDQKSPHHGEDVMVHTLSVLAASAPRLEIRWAALLHDIGKPAAFTLDDRGQGHFYGHEKLSEQMTHDIMRRLRCPRRQTEHVAILVRHHMRMYEHVTEASAGRLIQAVGKERLWDLFELQRADTVVCLGDRSRHLEAIHTMEMLCHEVIEKKLPMKVTDLAIGGTDMMTLGLKGQEIGKMLKMLLEEVTEGRLGNDQTTLIAWASNKMNKCSG